MDPVADAHRAQRAVGHPLPQRLDVGGRGELQRGDAASGFQAGVDHPTHDVAGVIAAMGVQHRRSTAAQPVHPHRSGRHVEFLGDHPERRHEVAGARPGRPHHLDGARGAIDGGGRRRARGQQRRCPARDRSHQHRRRA
jgi:hypothetical protein